MQHRSISASISKAPKTDPTAIPAIAPPDKPWWAEDLPAAAAEEPVADEVLLVEEGKRGGIEEVIGRVTPEHRVVTFEPTQQESVAFGELAAQ